MGKYTVPEEIRKLKPVGTAIKKINGQYYVYTHSQSKDPETGKWKTNPGKLIGKIIPGVGYCASAEKTKNQNITCFDYGQYLLACNLAKDDFKKLKLIFTPDEAMIIISLAIIFACNTYVELKASDSIFERSLIARDYPNLKFSYRTVSTLLELIGRQSKKNEFQKLCLEEASDSIAIDGHTIPTASDDNNLCSSGYKTKVTNSEYMNLMVALDAKTTYPLASRVYPGYMLDKKDFIDFIKDIGSIENKIILMDMGFYSEENTSFIEANKGLYVVPVSENRNCYKEAVKANRGRLAQFIYHANKKNDVVDYKLHKKNNGKSIIYYKNITEAAKLSQCYLSNIEKCKKGYTMEKYNELRQSFGIIVLETNHPGTAQEVYELYKKRWQIEVFYDRLKNRIHFEELNLDDWAVIQGVCFVMLIASKIDAKILKSAKAVKMSRKELITLMSYLKLTDDGNHVFIHNVKTAHREICTDLGLKLDACIKCLD